MNWNTFNEEIIEGLEDNPNITNTALAKELLKEYKCSFKEYENLRRHIAKVRNESKENLSYPEMVIQTILNPPIEKYHSTSTIKNTNFGQATQSNILVVADLHLPFSNKDYMNFCVSQYIKFHCNKVVFIGDLVENAAISYHDHNVEGYSAGKELIEAIKSLNEWYKVFPQATVTIGNHESLFTRKLKTHGLPKGIMKNLNDILQVPNWEFVEYKVIDNILFTHGIACGQNAAYDIALRKHQSVVIGHVHSEASIRYINENIFAMIVGCGISKKAYPFEYNKGFKKDPILSCGVIYGGLPIVIPMKG